MERDISFDIPSARELATLNLDDYTKLLRNTAHHYPIGPPAPYGYDDPLKGSPNPYHASSRRFPPAPIQPSGDYGLLVVSIWIIVIFGFFAVTLVFCIFSCLFYGKIRRWNETGKHLYIYSLSILLVDLVSN